MNPRVVLLACGSFNPPTPMHFRMFEIAKDHFESLGTHNIIGGIVSPVHDAYGKKDLIPAKHRCSMLRLALRTSEWIKLSEWEVNQENWTKTRYSLQYHQNYLNAFIKASKNGTFEGSLPSWIPDTLRHESFNNTGIDETDSINANYEMMNGNGDNLYAHEKIQLKLLCGADLLESFATPGLWSHEDLETILGDHGLVVISRSGSSPEKFIYDSDMLTKYKRNITIITNWVPNEVSSTMIRRLTRRGESIKYLMDDSVISYIKTHQLYGYPSKNIKYLTTYDPLQPTIITPSPDDIVMKSPSEFRMRKDENFNKTSKNTNISTKILNYLIGVDEVDKNDVYTSSPQSGVNHFKEKRSRLTNKISACSDITPKSFCGDYNDNGSTDSLEVMHILPRKSVKVITDVSGVHKIVNNKKKVCENNFDITDEVIVYLNLKEIVPANSSNSSKSEKNDKKLVLNIDNLNMEDCSNSEGVENPISPLRSYDEIVKFIFSEHGIQVISDRETVV